MSHVKRADFIRLRVLVFFLVIFVAGSTTVDSQVYYSVNPYYLKTKKEGNNLVSSFKDAYPDTSIANLHNYFPRNYLGNTGLSSPQYLLGYGTGNIGFRFSPGAHTTDRFHEEEIEYSRSKGPYAELTGVAGSKQLQIFKMRFTHTYKDKVNVTARFNRYTSQGYYVKQQTYTNNFFLSSNFASKNKRWGYYLYGLNNGNKNQENGGIRDRTLNDSTVLLNKDLLRARLSAANRDNRELKLMVNPWVKLNRTSDSISGWDHYLQLKSKLVDQSYRYKDVGMRSDKYYSLVYLDTVQTLDSSHIRSYINEMNYTLINVKGSFAFSAGYKNEINKVWQKTDSLFMNQIAQADLVLRKMPNDSLKNKNGVESHLNVQYVFMGPNEGNFKAENNFSFFPGKRKKSRIFLDALYEKRNPDYIYNNWLSNHFRWANNGYKSLDQFQLNTGVALGKVFSASVLYQQISNYLYFDNQALPRQYNKPINNLGITVSFNKVFFKHLGISLQQIVQNTSNTAYVRIPPGISTAKLFYNGILFKNALQLQIGSQVQVYQAFYAYAYMPATQAFHLQENFQTGTFPYTDVYLNARIRPVSFFLKVENVLAGIAGYDYSLVSGYYQPERAFRMGITWMFFD